MADEDDYPDERPFQLPEGDCLVFDPSYLDTEYECEGVLAASWSLSGGLWVLMGRHKGDKYTQTWEPVGVAQTPNLRSVT